MYRTRKSTKKYNPSKSHKKLRSGEKKCPFCSLDGREIIAKTPHNIVLKNLYEYQYWEFMKVTDHLMIVPLKHIESLGDLSTPAKVDTIDLIAAYEAKGYNVYAREKDNAVKSVPHQHTHLIKTENKRAKFMLYLRKPYFLFRR
jgi:diadenosine tetraphosphate (Ap4A) HIT family hydrolase